MLFICINFQKQKSHKYSNYKSYPSRNKITHRRNEENRIRLKKLISFKLYMPYIQNYLRIIAACYCKQEYIYISKNIILEKGDTLRITNH